MRIRASAQTREGSPTSSESEDQVVSGGHSPPGSGSRSHSPLRRVGSRQHFVAIEVRPDSPSQRRPSEDCRSAGGPPAGIKFYPYSATPSKMKFLDGLERIPSGELGLGLGEQCLTVACPPAHRRVRRLAHAVVVASVVILCFVVSRSSSMALAGDDAAGRTRPLSAPGSTPGSALSGAGAAGRYRARPFRMLTVCTGNTCRSPMMMALLKLELQRLGLKNVLVESAGTGERAALHRPASPHALTLFPEQLKDHRSRRITEQHLSVYDRIFCMTDVHKDAVVEQCMQEAKNASSLRQSGGRAGGFAAPGPDAASESEVPAGAEGARAARSRDTVAGASSSNTSDQTVPLAPVSGRDALEGLDGAVELEREETECNVRVSVFPSGLDDPYNKSLADYEECSQRLRGWVSEVLATLASLIRDREAEGGMRSRAEGGLGAGQKDSLNEV